MLEKANCIWNLVGNRGTEWREWWECKESGCDAGNQGGYAGNGGGNAGNQGENDGNQRGNAGNQGGNAGKNWNE